ncbi:prephenate dehydrogenase [Pseudolactococcus carnosus]|uniref:prephenate dehydrogenase n=1 Tax=Pseudolactococcus carnosus TaxID=2749961 RepID=UPI000BCD6A85|nr:prephenate dehydrogenase [Lactococcus carnosus]SOB47609.1 Prephenate dehydrogenase [Lactococcus piscium]MCJ1968865.1 prephenate dehydrogenase [Lactococcus carnosus]MCJ1974057.1 prephenate dehydrogenase [Lactococcus carnosus]MCJ1981111.1 prephenate dehydrogenase [Lactococcus carnosus]MCJ1987789.1 prephenate dehydrogenase [Lactococcus carnosus]
MSKKTILIAGLGLIGGSLARAIKAGHPEYHVTAYNRSQAPRDFAMQAKLVDEVSDDFEQLAVAADVIILNFPVQLSIKFLETLASLPLKPDVLISDSGSTKQDIINSAEKLFSGQAVRFVGGHPMAGSHKTGVIASDALLFENAYYILTPSLLSKPEDLAELKLILSETHAKFIDLSAAEHDAMTAVTSHFPHVVAAALVNNADDFSDKMPFTKNLAAGGFRDMTRIAESSPDMWAEILMSNPDNVVDQIDQFTDKLQAVKGLIQDKQSDAVWEFFDQARKLRAQMPIHKGAMDNFYDLFISIPDKSDAIHDVLGYFSCHHLSIINIKINETRVELNGVLQITFKTKHDLETAERLIKANTDYDVYQ